MMNAPVRTYLLLGSNQGDRQTFLNAARVRLEILAGPLVAQSAVYSTAPWGKTDQPEFLNRVVVLDTRLDPSLLLTTILAIEKSLGRTRSEKWEPRTMDIDILLYGDQVVHEPGLDIPHPAMAERRFVLTPLAEVAGDVVHPVTRKPISEMLLHCPDTLEVKRIVTSGQ